MYCRKIFVAVDLKTGEGQIYQGEPKNAAKPGVTLTLDDDNMVKLVSGKLNPQQVSPNSIVRVATSQGISFWVTEK